LATHKDFNFSRNGYCQKRYWDHRGSACAMIDADVLSSFVVLAYATSTEMHYQIQKHRNSMDGALHTQNSIPNGQLIILYTFYHLLAIVVVAPNHEYVLLE
jgi:hypothetical protein